MKRMALFEERIYNAQWMRAFLKSGHNLSDDRGFNLGIHFNAWCDAYTSVPAYASASTVDNPIDYCPTHCAMLPNMEKVSARMRNKLKSMWVKVMDNKDWQQKFISHRLITEL